jgi:transposase InsO family protein
MSVENLLWGAPRIHGELLKLGFSVAQSQNGFAERLIGSIRRECADHVTALGEAHLRRSLQAYARYYNEIRTHDRLALRGAEFLGIMAQTPPGAKFYCALVLSAWLVDCGR